MRTLQSTLEGLLDSDFDIRDVDVVTDKLCKWLHTAKKQKFTDANQALEKIMANAQEIPSMKRRQMSETNTIVTMLDQGNGLAYFNVVYRGNQPNFSHISYSWMGYSNDRAATSKGKGNLIDYTNKRKNSGLHCWALPAESFDILYNAAQ